MRLPPGQTLTRKFPVVGERAPTSAALDLASWRLAVDGATNGRKLIPYDELLAVADQQLTADIHCVTGWSQFDATFTGVSLQSLLERFAIQPTRSAQYVRFVAHSNREHDTSLPLAVALAESWLVHSVHGEWLTPEHGYPLRVVTPGRYFYKSLKWVRRIEFLEEDRPGFWERTSAYHNNADPWQQQRFEGVRFPARHQIEQFKELTDFSFYQQASPDAVLIKVNLSGWQPRCRDLRGLRLKACSLKGADLAGVDLRGANLTLCDLSGANLSRATLAGADLEGANFVGANLSHADLSHTHLSAARFVAEWPSESPVGLVGWDGLMLDGTSGLLESQHEYLNSLGVA